jgi:hypothetical protein
MLEDDDAKIAFAGAPDSTACHICCFISSRSGPFSCTMSEPATAVVISESNPRGIDGLETIGKPSCSRFGAISTSSVRIRCSIPGAGSQTVTSRPRANDEGTVATLTAQAANFGGSVEELAARRDDAELRLLRALDEVPAAA